MRSNKPAQQRYRDVIGGYVENSALSLPKLGNCVQTQLEDNRHWRQGVIIIDTPFLTLGWKSRAEKWFLTWIILLANANFKRFFSTPQTSNSKFEVSKSNTWKMAPFSKTTLLQREPFLTILSTSPHYYLPIVSTAFKGFNPGVRPSNLGIWEGLQNNVHCVRA